MILKFMELFLFIRKWISRLLKDRNSYFIVSAVGPALSDIQESESNSDRYTGKSVGGSAIQVHILTDHWWTGAAFELSDHKSMKETTITNYVCHPTGGVVSWQRVAGIISVISAVVFGDGWWPRGQASWCHGPGPGPRHGPGHHQSQEARAQHHHHWVSAFCHHQRWWQPVLPHTLHRQHAGENSSLGLKLRGEHRRSSWQWIFQLINFTITKIKEVCVCGYGLWVAICDCGCMILFRHQSFTMGPTNLFFRVQNEK